MIRDLAICVVLVAVTVAAYWPIKDAEFINYDDPGYFTDNSNVQKGLTLENIGWAFYTDSEFNWHPLTWLSYMTDYELFKWQISKPLAPSREEMQELPFRVHVTSVILHLLNVVLLYLVLKRLTKSAWPSAAVAALFALHPQHVESVAWVAERKDVLSALFWILTMGAYALYVERPSWQRYTAVCVGLALGLMAKPMLVTLPFVLLLLDIWPLGRLNLFTGAPVTPSVTPPSESRGKKDRGRNAKPFEPGSAAASGLPPSYPDESLWTRWQRSRFWPLIEKAPMLAMIVASSILTFIVQQRSGAMTYAERLTFLHRLANAPVAYATYLLKTFLPVTLQDYGYGFSVFYPHQFDLLDLQAWKVVLSVAVLVVITALVVWQWRRRPYLAMGWLFFVGTLVPVIGLVQVGAQAMADRYTYVPLIGLFIMAAWGAMELLASRWRLVAVGVLVAVGAFGWYFFASTLAPELTSGQSNAAALHWTTFRFLYLGLIAIFALAVWAAIDLVGRPWYLVVLVALGVLGVMTQCTRATYDQVKLWKNTKTLFFHTLDLCPLNAVAHCNLGESMFLRGEYSEAEFHFRAAIEIDDEQSGAHNNLGWSLARRGLVDEAIPHYKRALEIDPKNAAAHNNYALALASKHDIDGAIVELNKALELQHDYPAAHNNLGMALAEKGRWEESGEHYLAALALNENDLVARTNYSMVLSAQGRQEAALEQCRIVLSKEPRYAEAHNNLGLILCRMGRPEEALPEFQTAIGLNPNIVGARQNLGLALTQLGRRDEAIAAYREVLKLAPGHPEAIINLASLLRSKGQVAEAIALLESGLARYPDWAAAYGLLGWIYAVDPTVHNGAKAVELAERAYALTQGKDPASIEALAAAYAEAGRFAEAIAKAHEGEAIALNMRRTDVVRQMQERIKLYESGQPLRVSN